MSEPFVGEIRIFAGNFAPQGWAFCAGQLLPIAENEVLFNLIGTTYGGDGQSTFALPDFRGRVPIHRGQGPGLQNFTLGQSGGTETETLTTAQLPAHNHLLSASTQAPPLATSSAVDVTVGVPYVPASPVPKPKIYANTGSLVPMDAGAIVNQGNGAAHNNMAPYLAINFIISLFGIFPSQA